MPKKDLIEIVTVLDRSGSMITIKDDMAGGFDTFVKDQAAQPGEARMTLVEFDSLGIDTVYENKLMGEVPPLIIVPRAGTPLLDAMGQTIIKLGKRLADTPEDQRPEKVVMIIITDGEENQSKEFSAETVAKMVEEQEKVWKWNFVFLGANMDAIKVGKTLGVRGTACMSYMANDIGVASAYRGLSKSVSRMRSTGTPLAFEQDELDAAVGLGSSTSGQSTSSTPLNNKTA